MSNIFDDDLFLNKKIKCSKYQDVMIYLLEFYGKFFIERAERNDEFKEAINHIKECNTCKTAFKDVYGCFDGFKKSMLLTLHIHKMCHSEENRANSILGGREVWDGLYNSIKELTFARMIEFGFEDKLQFRMSLIVPKPGKQAITWRGDYLPCYSPAITICIDTVAVNKKAGTKLIISVANADCGEVIFRQEAVVNDRKTLAEFSFPYNEELIFRLDILPINPS